MSRRLPLPAGAGSIVVNASTLLGTTLVTSVLGVAFWTAAARLFEREAVGLASAAISTMTLLAILATLGFNTLLVGELGRQRERAGQLLSTGLASSATTGFVLGLVFALVAPSLSGEFGAITGDVESVAIFAVGVALTAMTLVLDQALIGLMRGKLQLTRNTVFAIVKLVAVVLVGALASAGTGLSIYVTWSLGTVLSLVVLAAIAARQGASLRGAAPSWLLLRSLRRDALGHHGFNIALKVPALLLPVIVVVLLSAELNASFYIAWMITSFAFAVPIALTTVLYAASAAEPEHLAERIRYTLRMSYLVAGPVVLITLIGAHLMLLPFGEAYADDADWTLRILMLSVLPMILKTHFVAICRIGRRVGGVWPLLLVWGGGGLELALAAIGATADGLDGLSVGFLVALCIEVAAMSPTIIRATGAEGLPSSPRSQAGRVVDGVS